MSTSPLPDECQVCGLPEHGPGRDERLRAIREATPEQIKRLQDSPPVVLSDSATKLLQQMWRDLEKKEKQ